MSLSLVVANRPWLSRITHWAGEVLLVFVGAYAAFWLTSYQDRQRDAQRHDQIVAALEDETAEAVASARDVEAREKAIVAKFESALAAGEMPPLRPFSFVSDYSATDVATLLQSGGYQLLEVKTLIALRNVESSLRSGLSAIAHFQKLSDELIVPNLDQDASFFYDPTTKKLRKRFADYPKGLKMTEDFFKQYGDAESELLKQLKAERRAR
jgi:hypothetical protein